MLAVLGDDRARFADTQELQCFSAIAPVRIHSGKAPPWVSRRSACPHFIRQSFHDHAAESIRHCRWARAYYAQ